MRNCTTTFEPIPLVRLSMGEDRIRLLALCPEDAAAGSEELPLGYQVLSGSYFAHWPPTPLELEQAIDYVEDQLAHVSWPLRGAKLLSSEGLIKSMSDRWASDVGGSAAFTRDDVERAFESLALVSQGRPVSHLEYVRNKDEAAALLLLRELMHHLDFSALITNTC